jgi:hypothetical protein
MFFPTILIVVVVAAVVWIFYPRLPVDSRTHTWFVLLAAGLGASVGASELVSRYRDEPVQALLSPSAMAYLFLNSLVSACVYGLLTRYSKMLIPALANDPLMRSIAAGFGAMALLRSKFFTLRTERGEDIAIGPDAAVSAFLATADRGVDRARAARRLDLVFRRAAEVANATQGKDFVQTSLAAFQNLSNDEKQALRVQIEGIYTGSKLPEELKLQALCYGILSIFGERNFNQLLSNLVLYANREAAKGEEVPRAQEATDSTS